MRETTLKDLQDLITSFCEERNWGQFHNPKDLSISLSLEASELLEHFQWKNNEEIAEHIATQKEAVGEELADILYWTLLTANNLDVNLSEAFLKKMEVNARKYPASKSKGNHKKYTEL